MSSAGDSKPQAPDPAFSQVKLKDLCENTMSLVVCCQSAACPP